MARWAQAEGQRQALGEPAFCARADSLSSQALAPWPAPFTVLQIALVCTAEGAGGGQRGNECRVCFPQSLWLLQPDIFPPTKTPAYRLAALRVQQMNQLCLCDEPLFGGRLNSFRGWRNGADGAACDRQTPASGTAPTPLARAGCPRPVAGVPGGPAGNSPAQEEAMLWLLLAPSLETQRPRPFPAPSRPARTCLESGSLVSTGPMSHGSPSPETPGWREERPAMDTLGTTLAPPGPLAALVTVWAVQSLLPNPLILSWTEPQPGWWHSGAEWGQ